MKSAVDLSLVEEMLAKTREEVEKMTPVNVMVVGKTGVGKSTLINSIFRENLATTGVGKPVTKHLQKITKEGVPMSLVDTRGLELSLISQKEITNEILETLATEKKKGVRDEIHVIYYCIQAMTARIEDPEIELITKLSQQAPVIIVLTQSLGTQAEEFKRYLRGMHLPVQAILNVMAQPYPIYGKVSVPAFGLMDLLEVTYEVVPREVGVALTNVQQIDIERKAKKARFWATKYIASTFGVGFVPVPFSDAAVLVPMQVTMMAHITSIFGMEMDKSTMTALVSVVGGTSGATVAGKFITSNLLKLVPGIGTVAGGVISGVTASMITTALAMSYIEVLVVMARKEQKGREVNPKEITKLLTVKLSQRIKQGGNQLVKELIANATGDNLTIEQEKEINSQQDFDNGSTSTTSSTHILKNWAKQLSYKVGELALVVSKNTLEGTNYLAQKTTDTLERYQQKALHQNAVEQEIARQESLNQVDTLLVQGKVIKDGDNVDTSGEMMDNTRSSDNLKAQSSEKVASSVEQSHQSIVDLIDNEKTLANTEATNQAIGDKEQSPNVPSSKAKKIRIGQREKMTKETKKTTASLTRKTKVIENLTRSIIQKQRQKRNSKN
ncbi:Uncharacterized conserved protein, DUF697 family [Granulicatella balaenopterae]|uniref:Uncharacterized conserved protein, DUF697 family n=1 Tax=Granulicatella balaenopterae TaxID=137733 RepID=A0A1H9JIN8_9LACT|nr:GTPase [Granulicatella balaenopterae]SEQ86732.1 Uncharacterized conserved protein, DUF697 family [Granulicatella balaenopterae]